MGVFFQPRVDSKTGFISWRPKSKDIIDVWVEYTYTQGSRNEMEENVLLAPIITPITVLR